MHQADLLDYVDSCGVVAAPVPEVLRPSVPPPCLGWCLGELRPRGVHEDAYLGDGFRCISLDYDDRAERASRNVLGPLAAKPVAAGQPAPGPRGR